MTAYGPECFTMNEVNRLKILQVVIHGRLIISLASNETAWHNGSALSALSARHCRHCRRLLARYR